MPYHTFQLRIKAGQVAPPPNAHRLRWMASHWMLSRLRLLALQFACSPLARFAGLPPEGAASFLSPPSGEMSAKLTEGVHFQMHVFV